jgi:cobalt/nickel transport system permease protein
LKHNFIDRYATLDSPLHALEPRTKLVVFTALIVSVLSIPASRGSLFFFFAFAAVILMGFSQVPLNYIVGRAFLMLPFIILASLAMPWKGYWGFGILFIRAILCLIFLILLTNTTRFSELLRGMRKLGCPQILAMNLSFLYRYIFVLTEEAMRMKQARDCRRTSRAPFREELKLLSSMLGTLLIRSFERAERMHAAMLSRGYSGDFPVVSPRKFSWRDLLFLSIATIFIFFSFHFLHR